MKKLIIGVLAVGAALALRPVVKRRMVQKMREHCKQMMSGDRSEAMSHEAMHQKMREHCGQMAAQHAEPAEPVATV